MHFAQSKSTDRPNDTNWPNAMPVALSADFLSPDLDIRSSGRCRTSSPFEANEFECVEKTIRELRFGLRVFSLD
jgi:hypothetical protein